MRRRAFMTAMGASALSPLLARAQPSEPLKRVGGLMAGRESAAEEQAHLAAFIARLKELGWSEGRNLRLDIRWGAGEDERIHRYAAELVALAPDVIITDTTQTVTVLQKATRTIPVVFAGVIDPVGGGFVESLARPGGNITGLSTFEYAIAAKWLELLKEVAPRVTRVVVLRDPTVSSGIGQFAAIQTVAPIGMELSVISTHAGLDEIERAVAAFARRGDGGLLAPAGPLGRNRPDAITALAARYKLPAVYPFRYYAAAGGLISYGPNITALYRPAAEYVDRILKGEKPSDLPVQVPTKYELVVNLKTAKALGIEVPGSLLARADEVIE
jgi:putative tryptophan/tyrosine transport system substrate-binding protein